MGSQRVGRDLTTEQKQQTTPVTVCEGTAKRSEHWKMGTLKVVWKAGYHTITGKMSEHN